MTGDVQVAWDEFLNAATVRRKLVSGSPYIAGYELLKDAIIGRIRDFFSWRSADGGYVVDQVYETDVLARSRSPLYASLDWLEEMGAIDSEDLATHERVKNCRNHLAHEMIHVVTGPGMPSDFETCFGDMVDLLRRISVWWIRNVDIPTNPEYDDREIDDADIHPGPVLGLLLLCQLALSVEDETAVSTQ